MSRTPFIVCISLAAACALMTGCGDNSGSADGSGGTGSTAAHALAHKPGQGVEADLVKAASPSKTGAAMDMKFKLGARPEAGKPVSLTLVFEPPPDDVDRMTVSLSASAGLSIEAGEGPATFVPSHGAPISHQMSVKAAENGIYSVTAAVLVDTLNNSESSRSFSVPIIVGDGIPAAPSAPTAAIAAANTKSP